MEFTKIDLNKIEKVDLKKIETKCWFCPDRPVMANGYMVCKYCVNREFEVQEMKRALAFISRFGNSSKKSENVIETEKVAEAPRLSNLKISEMPLSTAPLCPNFDPLYGMGDPPTRNSPWPAIPSLVHEDIIVDSDEEPEMCRELAVPYKHRSRPKPSLQRISIHDVLIRVPVSEGNSSDSVHSEDGSEGSEDRLQTLFKREQQRRERRIRNRTRSDEMSISEDSSDYDCVQERTLSWNEVRAQLTEPLPCPTPRELRCSKPMRGDPFSLSHEFAYYELTIKDCSNEEIITKKYLTLKNLNEKVNQVQTITMVIADHEWQWFQGEQPTYSWIIEDNESISPVSSILRNKTESSSSSSSRDSQIVDLSSETTSTSSSTSSVEVLESSSTSSPEVLEVSGIYPLDALEQNFNFVHADGQDWREEENANEVGNVEINYNVIAFGSSSDETEEEEFHDAHAGDTEVSIADLLEDAMRREVVTAKRLSVAEWISQCPCPPGCGLPCNQWFHMKITIFQLLF